MKKIVLFLFPLLLLSCNTKEDEPNNPKNDNTENTDLGYFNLIIANTSYLDDLYFSIEDLLYSNTLSPKSRALKVPITYIYQFNREYINEFIEHIYIERENSAQTRNNYLSWLRIFAGYLLKHGYVDKKVTDGIDLIPKRSIKKQRTVISESDLIRLQEYLKTKSSFSYPSDYYLFSEGLTPGPKWRSEKQFRDYWTHYVRKNLRFPASYKFYSLKDTGVTSMLRARIDNISVRDQARHSSILITDIYTPHDIEQANPIIQKFDTVF